VSNLGTPTNDFLCYIYYWFQNVTTSDFLHAFLCEYPLGMQANSSRSVFTFGFRSPLLCHLGRMVIRHRLLLPECLVILFRLFRKIPVLKPKRDYYIACSHAFELFLISEEWRLTGWSTSYVGTVFYNTLFN